MSQKPATDQKAGIPKKETTAEMDRKYIHAHSGDFNEHFVIRESLKHV